MQPLTLIQGNDQPTAPRVFTVDEVSRLAKEFADTLPPDSPDLTYRLLLSNFLIYLSEQTVFQRKRAEFDFENVWRRVSQTEWSEMKSACKYAYDAGRGAEKFEMNSKTTQQKEEQK